jgi:hypothetical protein
MCACSPYSNEEKNELQNPMAFSKSLIGEREYFKIYNNINDSIKLWTLNKLGYYKYFGSSKKHYVDSVLCFNKNRTRLITCVIQQQLLIEGLQDDLQYLFGEKISGNWYFFSGATIALPREIYQKDIHTPIPYNKLHEIALNEVYSGYLNENGEINEDWFTANFEGSGWGDFNNQASIDWILEGKRFTSKKEFFEFAHLTVVKSNWNGVNKDSIKQLPPKNNLP